MSYTSGTQPHRSGRLVKGSSTSPATDSEHISILARALFNPLVVDHTGRKALMARMSGTDEQLSELRQALDSAVQTSTSGQYADIRRFYPAGSSRAYSLLHALSISLNETRGFNISSQAMYGDLRTQSYQDVINQQQVNFRNNNLLWWKRTESMHPVQALAILKTHEMVTEANQYFGLGIVREIEIEIKESKGKDPNIMSHMTKTYDFASLEDLAQPDSGIRQRIRLYHNSAAYGSADSCFAGLCDRTKITAPILHLGPQWKAQDSCTEPEACWRKESIPQYAQLLRELSIWPGSAVAAKTVATLAREKAMRGPGVVKIQDRVKTALVFYFGETIGKQCYSEWIFLDRANGDESTGRQVEVDLQLTASSMI